MITFHSLDDLLQLISAADPKPAAIDLHCDHRSVTPGSIFFAIPGNHNTGLDFIPAAIAAGAVHIVVTDATSAAQIQQVASQIVAPHNISPRFYRAANIRHTIAHCSRLLYPEQPEKLVAITGTNGKTSTSHFYACLAAAYTARRTAYLGTMGLIYCEHLPPSTATISPQSRSHFALTRVGSLSGGLTTPDAKNLHCTLQHLAKTDGITHAAIEASSHGLHQHRVDYIECAAAAFTNLSHDHLDYHATMEEYFAAKLRLFTAIQPRAAVINLDDTYGRTIAATFTNCPTITYGKNPAASLKLLHYSPGNGFSFTYQGQTYSCPTPLIGEFQIYNLLAATGLFLATEPTADLRRIVEIIPQITAPAGRMEEVAPNIYVDYSHTPDALRLALLELAQVAPHNGRKWLIFGCGGNRDRGKRTKMIEVASSVADVIIITDDNPRHEDPAAIRREIIAGSPPHTTAKIIEIGDRGTAIHQAIAAMSPEDILLIAGKGHESFQIIGDKTIDFCDATTARSAFNHRFSGSSQ